MKHKFTLRCGICGHIDGPYPYTATTAGLIERTGWGIRKGRLLCPECYQRNKYDYGISPFEGALIPLQMVRDLTAIIEDYEDSGVLLDTLSNI